MTQEGGKRIGMYETVTYHKEISQPAMNDLQCVKTIELQC